MHMFLKSKRSHAHTAQYGYHCWKVFGTAKIIGASKLFSVSNVDCGQRTWVSECHDGRQRKPLTEICHCPLNKISSLVNLSYRATLTGPWKIIWKSLIHVVHTVAAASSFFLNPAKAKASVSLLTSLQGYQSTGVPTNPHFSCVNLFIYIFVWAVSFSFTYAWRNVAFPPLKLC